MNFSYTWLRELVEGLEVAPAELGRLITMKTAECEGVIEAGAHLARVVAARVLSVEPIPGSHNVKAVIDAGSLGRKTVVCGAPNCRPGIVTAYVPAGVKLGEREIGRAVIGGVESEGMLASGAELNVNRDAAGVLEINAEPGAPIPGCSPDFLIEIDNKSLTHRPDLWGHFGMAREAAAISRRPLRDPVKPALIPSGPAPIQIAIQDFELCQRYSALVFENVKVQPSPLWLQRRLQAIGLNPINNIVDVTNYIMAELAQPVHAFDRDLLRGDAIYIRPAPAGALFVALNQESYTLDPANLVIADARGPVALAGVIGGLDSAIGERTTRIVLESACFQATSVRKTSAKLKLRTEASMRCEKAQDPENTVRGLARAVALFQEATPGARLVGGLADQRKPAVPPSPIELPLDWLAKKLGCEVPAAEVRDILERLAFGVSEPRPRVFSVTVPSWRATKDIAIKDDLVEEVGRMIGYDSVTPRPPRMAVVPPPDDPQRTFHRSVRALIAAQGFTEVYNYSFLSEEQVAALGFDPAAHVRVANPIAADQCLMRLSLLPGIYRNIQDNARHFDSFRLFEIGREIHKREAGLPDEVPHLAVAVYSREDGAAGLFELKRVAECLMPGAEVQPVEPRPFEHPARSGDVLWLGQAVGRLFEFHPEVVNGRAAVLDIDLRLVETLRPHEKRYKPIRRYPASAFDLSVIAGARQPAGELRKRMAELAGPQLETIVFLREYSGPPIPEGMKSASFRLTVAASDHTLSQDEVAAIRAAIIDGMQKLGHRLTV